MTREALESRLRASLAVIDTLPAEQRLALLALIEETRGRYEDVRQSLDRARNALDDWRICQKYLVFDAEARAREAAEPRTS